MSREAHPYGEPEGPREERRTECFSWDEIETFRAAILIDDADGACAS